MKLPRIRLPRWLKILLALGAVFLVGVVLPLWIWLTADIAPRDDSDLVVEFRVVAAEDNGFELVNFGDDVPQTSQLVRDTSGFDESWDPVAGREAVEAARPYLDRIERALARPDFRVPDSAGSDGRFPYLIRWRGLGRLFALRARIALDDGRLSEAVDDAFRLMGFGQRITRADDVWFTHVIGATLMQEGYLTLGEVIGRAELPAAELRALPRRLEQFAPSLEDLSRSMRISYTIERSAIVGLYDTGTYDGESIPFASVLTCVHETRHLVAELVRTTLRDATRPLRERSPRTKAFKTTRIFGVDVPTSPRNMAGRALTDSFALFLEDALTYWDAHRVAFRAHLALVGVRAYHADHGRLPDSLEALVPKYLDVVPIDPYDGKPLRYSRANQRIWSVGDDGVDAGGLLVSDGEPHNLGESSEPTLTIRFDGE